MCPLLSLWHGRLLHPENRTSVVPGILSGMTRARITGRRITLLRARWRPEVDAGRVTCPRCREKITPDPTLPGDGWDLGHVHDLALGGHPAGTMVPEHSSCNRRAGGQLGQALRPRRTRRRVGDWL